MCVCKEICYEQLANSVVETDKSQINCMHTIDPVKLAVQLQSKGQENECLSSASRWEAKKGASSLPFSPAEYSY